MTDLERRLRDTYAAALDSIEAHDRLADLPIPSRWQTAPSRRWRPALAFGAAALATLLVVGGIAVFSPGGAAPETVATVRPAETVHVAAAGTLTEVRFSDAAVVAVGGVGGRPAAVALTEDGSPVVRVMASPGEWEDHAMDPWPSNGSIVAFGSDGDALAIAITDGEGGFTMRLTTDGESWTTATVATAGETLVFGNPAARLTSAIRDVSVDGTRVTLLVSSMPDPDATELEDSLRRLGELGEGVNIDQITEWGPDGIGVRLSDGTGARPTLDELGIDPAWANGVWEAAVVDAGSSTAMQIDAEPAFTPLTATTADDGLYVGGVDGDGARLVRWDLASLTFAEVNLSDLIDENMAPLRAATSLRTTAGTVVAGVSAQEIGIALRLDGTALTAWNMAGSTSQAVAEMAVRGGSVGTVGYPGVVVTGSGFGTAGVATASVPDDFGIADRHPTGITLTDAGLIALPQAGSEPSSFGSDGSAWLIDLGGSAATSGDD